MPLTVRIPTDPEPGVLDVLDGTRTAVQRQLRRAGLTGYEPLTQATLLTLARNAPPGTAIYDIGAHIGFYSALVEAVLGRDDLAVQAFEPAPDTAAIARDIRARNGLRYEVVETAIADRVGTAELYLSLKAETSNSLNPGHRSHNESVQVPVTTLDAYTEQHDLTPYLIKIDVETYEASVLEGALETIRRHRPWIVCELLPGNDDPALGRVLGELEDLGYGRHLIDLETPWPDRPRNTYRSWLGRQRDWLLAPEPLSRELYRSMRSWLSAILACDESTNNTTARPSHPLAGEPIRQTEGDSNPMTTSDTTAAPRSINDIPGWFYSYDRRLFDFFLDHQDGQGITGDLLEMGAYLGKSAVLIGRHVRPGETFTVCDLFGELAPTEANRHSAKFYTKNLTRSQFESNYLAFHSELPTIVQEATSAILDHVKPDSCRFVHVDAAHLYDCVRDDIRASRELLRNDGVIALDDYRTEKVPGCGAAIWEAVFTGGLRPIAVSPAKLYATWGDPAPVQDALLTWVAGRDDLRAEVQQVAGSRLVRVAKAKSAAGRATDKNAEKGLAKATKDLKDTTRQLDEVRTSASYRVGRALTALPRALRPRRRKS